jgi:hypothetical protein
MRYNVHVTGTRFTGADLAWREGSADLVANETGVAVIDADGRVRDAGWKRGVEQTIARADSAAADGDAVMFVDALLVIGRDRPRLAGQVGQGTGAGSLPIRQLRFPGGRVHSGRSGVSWRYSDGTAGCRAQAHRLETTAAAELGYDTERPRYKRKPRCLRAAQWRTERAATCDTLIERPGRLADADPAAPAPFPSGHQGAGRPAVTGHQLRV